DRNVTGVQTCALPIFEQDGRTVFRWAVWHTAQKIREMLEKSGLGIEDVDVFVPHQANMRIIDELAKQLKLAGDVVIGRDIAETRSEERRVGEEGRWRR